MADIARGPVRSRGPQELGWLGLGQRLPAMTARRPAPIVEATSVVKEELMGFSG